MTNKQCMFHWLISLVLFCHLSIVCLGHLIRPASRGTLWKSGVGVQISERSVDTFCGGNSNQELSVSGQPFKKGVISGTYFEGEHATFEIDETGLDKGFVEFKICSANTPDASETQECFDQHPVALADGSGTKYPISDEPKVAKVDVEIPKNLECNFCVLQYHFHSGYESPTAKEKKTCSTCWQKDIYGCSDIVITPNAQDVSADSGIQGIIVKGPGNFGNIIGNGATSSGTNNAWSNVNSNGQFTHFNGQTGSQQNGGYAPLINGILVKGAGNFGNILGPGAVSTGTNNAWSNVNTDSSPTPKPAISPLPAPNPCANYLCTKKTEQNIDENNATITTTTTTTTEVTVRVSALIKILQSLTQGNQHGSIKVQIELPVENKISPSDNTNVPSSVAAEGQINVNSQGNFGNSIGAGAVSTGTNNAWSNVNQGSNVQQNNDAAPSRPSADQHTSANGHTGFRISVNGHGNFGNILGQNAVSTGTNNAWSNVNQGSNVQNVNQGSNVQSVNQGSNVQQNKDAAPSRLSADQHTSVNGHTGFRISVNGNGNFGNILGQKAISTGTNNAWSNVNQGSNVPQNHNQAALKPLPDVLTLENRPLGPRIKGITVNGPGNFGNILGQNSVSSGTNNAWSHVNQGSHYQNNLRASRSVPDVLTLQNRHLGRIDLTRN